MSGAKLPQKIEVTYNNRRYNGCGRYLADYRLSDIWKLVSINDTPIDAKKLQKGAPTLEINLRDGQVIGRSGCNGFGGLVELKGRYLTISRKAGTMMFCEDDGFEKRHYELLSPKEIIKTKNSCYKISLTLVKQNAGASVINNPEIPDSRNDEAVEETSNSIMNSLKGALSGVGLKQVIDMFSSGKADTNNLVVQQATGDLTGKLQDKFGLDNQQAAGVAGSLVPEVMNQLAQKAADPADDSFDLQSIFNQLSGGKTSGMNLQEMLSKFKGGLDKDGDGDVDFQDLKTAFSGDGSIMDKVKGMFK